MAERQPGEPRLPFEIVALVPLHSDGGVVVGTLQANERTKAWSTVVTNLGTALFASAFGRMWLVGLDIWGFVWLVVGIAIIGGGIHLLTWLEAES